MHKHSSRIRGNDISANKSLWPDCAIEADPYRLPAHIAFSVPSPRFSNVSANRIVSIYNGFVVITDKLGQHSTNLRIISWQEFDAIVVRVGFSSHGYRQIGSAVYLHHAKLGLELPLYAASDCRDTAAFWLAWSRVTGVPAMSIGKDGLLSNPFNRVGKLQVGRSLPRREILPDVVSRPVLRRQSALQQRRMAKAIECPQSGVGHNQSNVYRLFS